MLFSSTIFIFFFLPISIGIYYGLLKKRRKLQNVFLAIISLFFYAWGEPKFVLIMLLSIMANWFFGLGVGISKEKKEIKKAKLFVALAVIFNLSLLYIFKYLTFSAGVIENAFNFGINVPQIALPIGISFFTFQAMSYVIDVYREKGMYQKNIINIALYVSFFPQLIAGPIVRYETVANEINNRKETLDDFFSGFARFVIGLGKKVLISNSLSIFADKAFESIGQNTVGMSWLGIICYTFQIFFDFSGYSDMAIGLGQMFGFHFLENFDYPYISKSITEFWRRWHISLGTWFRDYVYIPLGGSRVKKQRLIFNLFVVWGLTGVWHGANWTFIIWGLMYFVLITIEKFTGLDKKQSGKFIMFLRWIYSMFFVLIGWVVFRADSLSQAILYIKSMFGLASNKIFDTFFFTDLKNAWIYLLVAFIFSIPTAKIIKAKLKFDTPVIKIIYNILLILVFILSLASIVSSSHNPFIYFNF